MALYEYESESGERIEVERPMTNAPPVGHAIKRRGVTFKRKVSRPTVNMAVGGRRTGKIVAPSLGLRETIDPALHKHVSGWTEQGIPCFDGAKQAERYCAAERAEVERTGQGHFHTYGDGPDGVETTARNQARDRVKFDR